MDADLMLVLMLLGILPVKIESVELNHSMSMINGDFVHKFVCERH